LRIGPNLGVLISRSSSDSAMGVSGDDDDDSDGVDESAREMRETVVYDRCGMGSLRRVWRLKCASSDFFVPLSLALLTDPPHQRTPEAYHIGDSSPAQSPTK
jgi:hypothetical protein